MESGIIKPEILLWQWQLTKKQELILFLHISMVIDSISVSVSSSEEQDFCQVLSKPSHSMLT